MTKTRIISSYIKKCESVLESKNMAEAEELVDEIIAVYSGEINDITVGLDSYAGLYYDRKIDYLRDIKFLKAKLENYRSDIKRTPVGVNKGNTYNISATSTSTSTVNNEIKITFEQTIENINKLSPSILSDDEKQELEDKLASLRVVADSKDKDKIGKKLLSVLKFAITKGPETFIAISNFINFITNDVAPLFK